ncbi:hypothetical protein E2C01_019787 [Portunus trituberculatus]|uniref:Uncharacterized protein n=1 Tax=Portunus trituberculatus TaxID=210409 RepID=A0A5B7DYE4_PORTR|nr:hypothetical protein [Portunus trituberculatus]
MSQHSTKVSKNIETDFSCGHLTTGGAGLYSGNTPGQYRTHVRFTGQSFRSDQDLSCPGVRISTAQGETYFFLSNKHFTLFLSEK